VVTEPGLNTSITTDNSQFDASMKRSEASLELLTAKIDKMAKRAAASTPRIQQQYLAFRRHKREADSLSAALVRLESDYLDIGNAASRSAQRVTESSRSFRMLRGQMYNASVQLQDVAVQIGAGTSAITALSQNVPQFLSFFGPQMALLGAFVAAVPLVVAGYGAIAGATKDFGDELSGGKDALDAYIGSLKALNSSFGDSFDKITAEIEKTSVATADLAIVHEQRAMAAIRGTTAALADANTEASIWRKLTLRGDVSLVGDLLEIETALQGNITTFKDNREAVKDFIEAVRGIDEAQSLDGMYEAALRVREIFLQNVDVTGQMTGAQLQFFEQLALTIQQLELMGAAQEANNSSIQGYIQYYTSLQRAAELRAKQEERQQQAYEQYYASRIQGEEFINNQIEEQRQRMIEAYGEYGRTRDAADELKVELTDAALQAMLIASTDMTSPIAQAAQEALTLAENLGIAVDEAAALALERRALDVANAPNIAYAGRGTTSSRPAIQVDEQGRTRTVASILAEQERERQRANRPSRGGAAKVDPFIAKMEQLRESLMTEEELERQSYERRTQLLEEFLQRQPEKLKEYQDLQERLQAEHQQRMAEIDVYRYGTGLQQAETFFGEMATALRGGNEQMMKIAQAFGAAEALINAWRGYAQVIGDPTVPWFAKVAKAAAVLSAGLGAVQAIKGASPGGTSSGGGGAAAVGGAAAAPIPTQTVSINLQGDTFSRSSVEGLLEQIQSQLDRGGRLVFS
jgi:hypothetical protein